MKPYILIAEDEESIATLLRYNLEKEGFEVDISTDGKMCLVCVSERTPDLIVLDWMMPIINGIEVCRKLRADSETKNIPIIMLTAKSEETDSIVGLNNGADDYIVKPFSPKELIARINAVLRRIRPALAGHYIEYSGIKIDISGHKVTYGKQPIHIGPTEFRLLTHLVENPTHVFTRDQLLDAVWGNDVYIETRTVDVHMRRLRKALSKAHDGLGDIIKTVHSVGYVMEI